MSSRIGSDNVIYTLHSFKAACRRLHEFWISKSLAKMHIVHYFITACSPVFTCRMELISEHKCCVTVTTRNKNNWNDVFFVALLTMCYFKLGINVSSRAVKGYLGTRVPRVLASRLEYSIIPIFPIYLSISPIVRDSPELSIELPGTWVPASPTKGVPGSWKVGLLPALVSSSIVITRRCDRISNKLMWSVGRIT